MTSHFDNGWRDRLADVSPPEVYSRPAKVGRSTQTKQRIQYERGRHAASLWLFECGRVEQPAHGWRSMSYDEARKHMTDELKRLLEMEAQFCKTKSELTDWL